MNIMNHIDVIFSMPTSPVYNNALVLFNGQSLHHTIIFDIYRLRLERICFFDRLMYETSIFQHVILSLLCQWRSGKTITHNQL